MTTPLTKKLASLAHLSGEDRQRLDQLSLGARPRKAGTILINEGDKPNAVFLLVDGWAARSKVLRDGKRQIVALLLPGDLCDVQVFILREMDHALVLLSDAVVAEIPKQTILDLFEESPAISRALWWSTLVDEAILREWLANQGQRDAYARISHLLAELWLRLGQVGYVARDSFQLPLTQEELGDTLGLTSVHTNRTLQRLRADGLIELQGGTLRILDVERLLAASGFQSNYLHLATRQLGSKELDEQFA